MLFANEIFCIVLCRFLLPEPILHFSFLPFWQCTRQYTATTVSPTFCGEEPRACTASDELSLYPHRSCSLVPCLYLSLLVEVLVYSSPVSIGADATLREWGCRWYSIGYKRSLRFFSKSTPTDLGLRSGFESPDLERPGRQLHQQGLSEARLGYRGSRNVTLCLLCRTCHVLHDVHTRHTMLRM